MLKGIKTIIFDLGGVLLNIDYHSTSRAFEAAGFVEFDSFYSQAKQSSLFDHFETGKIKSQGFCEEVGRISGLDIDEIVSCWNAMLLDLPAHRIEFLKSLKGKYQLILLSNTNEIHLDSFRADVILKYGGDVLVEIFDRIYYSHELGLRKPNANCFNAIIDQNDLKAEETLFIDDSNQHVVGAAQVGLRSILLNAGVDVTSLFAGTTL